MCTLRSIHVLLSKRGRKGRGNQLALCVCEECVPEIVSTGIRDDDDDETKME